MPITCTTTDGIAEIVMENPPVNALTVAGWFELAEVILAAGRDQSVGAVVPVGCALIERYGWFAGSALPDTQA